MRRREKTKRRGLWFAPDVVGDGDDKDDDSNGLMITSALQYRPHPSKWRVRGDARRENG